MNALPSTSPIVFLFGCSPLNAYISAALVFGLGSSFFNHALTQFISGFLGGTRGSVSALIDVSNGSIFGSNTVLETFAEWNSYSVDS